MKKKLFQVFLPADVSFGQAPGRREIWNVRGEGEKDSSKIIVSLSVFLLLLQKPILIFDFD